MNANKDEAIRAKDIAENLMKKTDFSGARRFALKAQKLDSTLEGISQMIMVCDVHCAATGKSYGNEMDWYGILQVEPNTDDITIKKQYRKLALLLHPDKNKLPGAESAFKLIGEAQRILLDRDKRSLHDMKRKTSVSKPVPAKSYCPQKVATYYTHLSAQSHNIRNNFSGLRPENQHPQRKAQAQSAAGGCQPSFWTACPFCHVRYEYHREVINKWINCQNCNRQFTAFVQADLAAKNFCKETLSFSQQRKVPSPNACYVEKKHQQGSTSYYSGKESFPVSGCTAKVGTETVGGKRKRRKIVDSSESSDSESSNESEEDVAFDENCDIRVGQDFGPVGGEQPRRSGRSKRQVSYRENLSDDDEFVNYERSGQIVDGDAERGEGSEIRKELHENDHSKVTLPNGINGEKKMNRREKDPLEAAVGNSEPHEPKNDSSSGGAAEPRIYDCADPDFNDFDKLREKGKFAIGQIWAIYDPADGMPRFYAEIIKVFSPVFRLKIAWLEPDPDDEKEIQWCEGELPVSVGRYRFGKSQITKDHLMFSHVIYCQEEMQAGAYMVFPRKGETWALFKNWDINWSSDPDSHREYEYEFVETLSEYSEETGICVACLYKVKGFSSVFCRMVKDGTDTFQIPPHELYRLSHSVPSFKLIGNEGKGVPNGSYELDPASLPPPTTTKDCGSPVSYPEGVVTSELQLYNFDDDKSEEKFQVGQIWQLCRDELVLPKYYARIQRVEREPSFRLHISWLELKTLPENVIQWRDKEMPICCGTFSAAKGGHVTCTVLAPFSHQITPAFSKKRNEYTIFPEKGDVWAIYKNWSNEIKISDLKDWHYDVVEVVDGSEAGFEVLLLDRVDGYNSVFRKAMKQGLPVRVAIPMAELLRFSHRVPVVRLDGEREGTLRGFLELDPAALSRNFFCS